MQHEEAELTPAPRVRECSGRGMQQTFVRKLREKGPSLT